MADKIKKEYRVTRPEVYGPNTPGQTNPAARQGYYADGTNELEAVIAFLRDHPDEAGRTTMVDVQLWKVDGVPTSPQTAKGHSRWEITDAMRAVAGHKPECAVRCRCAKKEVPR